jgi:hypothetical protein
VAQKRHEQDVPQKNEDASPFSERDDGMRSIFVVSVFPVSEHHDDAPRNALFPHPRTRPASPPSEQKNKTRQPLFTFFTFASPFRIGNPLKKTAHEVDASCPPIG